MIFFYINVFWYYVLELHGQEKPTGPVLPQKLMVTVQKPSHQSLCIQITNKKTILGLPFNVRLPIQKKYTLPLFWSKIALKNLVKIVLALKKQIFVVLTLVQLLHIRWRCRRLAAILCKLAA